MQDESKNMLLGVIIGVAFGAVAVYLLGTPAGAKTRVRMRRMTEQAREKSEELRSRGREYAETTRSRFQEAIEAGRRAAEAKRAELESEARATPRRVTVS